MMSLPFMAAWCYVPSRGVSVPDHMFLPKGRSLSSGSLSLARGISAGRPSRIRKASGTHTTGMLSC